MKPLTRSKSRRCRSRANADGGVPVDAHAAERNLKVFSHNEYQISYPENWQVFGDPNSNVTIAPRSGVSQNAVAYGVIIANYQPEDPERVSIRRRMNCWRRCGSRIRG